MRKIMACLDVGSDTIKLVVGEIVKKKLNILAASTAESKGIVNGIVEDANLIIEPLQDVIQRCEEVIGLPIKQMVVAVPANDAVYSVVTGTVKITNEGNSIEGKDVIRVMQQAIKNGRDDKLEYISMMPTSFSLDDNRIVKEDPKGLTSKGLSVRGVMVSTPKKNIYPILAALERLGVVVLDITLSSIGDYFEFKNKTLDKGVSAIINMGNDITTLSVFHKGVLTNTKVLNVGGNKVDSDLSYVYRITSDVAKGIKESSISLSIGDNFENVLEVLDKNGKKISISQLEMEKVVSSRLLEILNLCKKEINLLTKKEISYIIFTGGLTESRNFSSTLEEVFDSRAKVGDIHEIGVRHNKYSVCLGLLKFYAYNAKLKDKDYSIFTIEEQQILSGANYDEQNDSVIGKLFGYIFNG